MDNSITGIKRNKATKRKVLEKIELPTYNNNGDKFGLSRREIHILTGFQKIKGCLVDDKGTWTVRARITDTQTGKSKQKVKSTGYKVKDHTKRRAEQAMQNIIDKWEEEINAPIITVDPLFSDYVLKFLEKASFSKRENTMMSYQEYADKHILPELGHIRICELNQKMLQSFYEKQMAEKNLSVSSIRKHNVVVSGALNEAVEDGIIGYNFANCIKFPSSKRFNGKTYTPEQVAKLFEVGKCEGEPIQSAIILGVCYGLRRSEICGLRWKDIDFEKREIHIQNTITQNGELWLEKEQTKTVSSNRIISMIEHTAHYLQTLKQSQIDKGLELDKVCRWPDGKTVQPNYVTHKLDKILKKYGMEHIRLHDLRHTAASLLATKASPKQVQEFLGHSSITTTLNTYTHLMDDERKKTSGLMDSILKDVEKDVDYCSDCCSEME